MPPELASLEAGMVRYNILPNPELSLLSSLFRCVQKPEEESVDLLLQDPESLETLPVRLVRLTVTPEEDRKNGIVHFGGILDDGKRIRCHFKVTPSSNPAEPIGSAIIRF